MILFFLGGKSEVRVFIKEYLIIWRPRAFSDGVYTHILSKYFVLLIPYIFI